MLKSNHAKIPQVISAQSITANSPCTVLKGVGSRVAERLAKLQIYSLEDLLFHLPLHYQDRTQITSIRRLRVGMYAVIEGAVIEHDQRQGRRNTSFLVRLADASGEITLRFFHLYDQQRRLLSGHNNRLRCFGEIRFGTHGLEMIHPEFQLVTGGDALPLANVLTPIYPTTEGVNQQLLRRLIKQAVDLLNEKKIIDDYLPQTVLAQYQFPDLITALTIVHQPPRQISVQALEGGNHPAKQRLAFEELLAHQISRRQLRKQQQRYYSPKLVTNQQLIDQYLQQLGFALTTAQKRVSAEITEDLLKAKPMMRLVHGDVGAGKTVIAAIAALQAIANDYQVVLMAPTEILAEQHLQNFQRWFTPLNISIVCLWSQLKTKERELALQQISDGQARLVIGTHALFQAEVKFANLALVIIDEQHRFGVHQRLALQQKGSYADYMPHQLIMTATPIPRTLAMTAYADLDCSVLDELPPGRQPITTVVIANDRRQEVIERVQQFCRQGQQVYWVCALIDESELLNCEAAEKTKILLQQELPNLSVGLLHGRLSLAEKEQVVALFKNKKMDLLVATTVIEVGVDIPNANLMIIENAERFGLAQLHQLRGRVGRGNQASYCVLMYQAPLSAQAKLRLQVMRENQDGFAIAAQDLKIRGPGEWLGTKQAGLLQFRVADLWRDQALLPIARHAADQLIEKYPAILPLLLKRWIGDKYQYQRA